MCGVGLSIHCVMWACQKATALLNQRKQECRRLSDERRARGYPVVLSTKLLADGLHV